jgi:RNA recognition motif-containing protein
VVVTENVQQNQVGESVQAEIKLNHHAYGSARRSVMSTFEKRAREDKRNSKAREKEQRRQEKRNAPSSGPQLITADQINGNLRSIEEVMRSLEGGSRTPRSAPPIPTKLFAGSLSDSTTSAALRAHFEPFGLVAEAVVITDRNTGASRNFGFVTMADRKDAPQAIAALHHSELDGNRIVVNVATER